MKSWVTVLLRNKPSPGYETLLTFSPLDVEMSICCHRTDFSVLTGLFAVLGWPTEFQRKGEEGEGGGGMDGWMMGWEGGGVTVPKREGEWGLLERTSRTTKLTCPSSWVVMKKAL